MAAQDPIILDELDLPADVWTKVGTAVRRGFIHILKGDLVYYQTHRLTGGTAPDDLILPDNPDFEGVPVYYRLERIAGESVVVGVVGINSSVDRDIYIYCEAKPGKIRFDEGA
jgi:hypothetical protein